MQGIRIGADEGIHGVAWRWSAVGLLCLLLASTGVQAGTGGIGNATVNQGDFATQLRFSVSDDDQSAGLDGRFRNRLMLDYGISDDVALGFYIQGDNRGGDNQELDAFILDARYELAQVATDGYYTGFRLRYTYKDGDKKPDNFHIRLIAGLPVDQWDFRINQILAYQVGEDNAGGLGVDTRLQASYRFHPDHRAGLESFSNFGFGSGSSFDEQAHTLGPIFAGKIAPGLSYEAGYRYGLSDAAADHTLRVFLAWLL